MTSAAARDPNGEPLDRALAQRVLREHLGSFYGSRNVSVATHIGFAIALGVATFERSSVAALSWLGLVVATDLAVLLAPRWHAGIPDAMSAAWARRYAAQVTLLSLVAAPVPAFFMAPDDMVTTTLLVVVIMSGWTRSMQSLCSLKPALYGYGIPMMAGLVLALAWQGDGVHLFLAVFGAVHLVLTLRIATRQHRVLDEALRLRFRNEVLAARLGEQVVATERASQEKSRFLGTASHDLRQPLHALSVYSAILATSPTPATLDEVATHIDQLVRSLGALLHGLLDLSQLSSGHYVPVRQRFALDAVIANVCAEFEAAAAKKGLYFERELRPVTLESDPTAVLRIARNLIDNAIKYTERGGLRVRLRHDGLCAILVVEDSGKGIAASEHAHIFEEFYQLGNAGRDRSQGVGLGLAIVERLVTLIGARISVRSRLGAGSRFEVRMPGVRDAPPPVAAAAPAPMAVALEVVAGSRPRIYLVDDEPDIVRGMTTLLQAWKLEVRTALDVAGTAALFDEGGCPDLLIADLRLRGNEHGPALVARMREIHGEFPVAFITGETSSEALREARATRWPLLHKPVDAQTLRATIQSLLAAHGTTRL